MRHSDKFTTTSGPVGAIGTIRTNGVDSVAALLFKADKQGSVSSKYKGSPVRLDPDSADLVKDGDTWMCHIEQNNKDKCWSARAVKKADAEFFVSLKADQRTDLAKCMWSECRDIIEPLFKDWGLEEIKKETAAAKSEVKKLRPMEKKNTELVKASEKQKTTIADLKQKLKDASGTKKDSTELNEKLAAAETEIKKLTKKLETTTKTQGETTRQKELLASANAEITELKEKLRPVADLENENSEMESQIMHANEEITDLLQKLNVALSYKEDANRLRSDLISANAEIKDLEIRLEETKKLNSGRTVSESSVSKDAEIRELRTGQELLNRMILDLTARIDQLSAGNVTVIPEQKKTVIENATYLGADELYYRGFSDGKYDVKMSMDRSKIVASPNPKGKIECVMNTMILSGLDGLVQPGKRILNTEADGESVIIYLK